MDLEVVKTVKYEEYKANIISIRDKVFIQEQSVPKEIEIDGLDPLCRHALAIVDGNAIATGRIQQDGHIGRVAVLPEFRGKGYGKKIIHCLIEAGIQMGLNKVYLGAQLSVLDFYNSMGFKPYGDIFIEANIKHIMMNKHL